MPGRARVEGGGGGARLLAAPARDGLQVRDEALRGAPAGCGSSGRGRPSARARGCWRLLLERAESGSPAAPAALRTGPEGAEPLRRVLHADELEAVDRVSRLELPDGRGDRVPCGAERAAVAGGR